MKLTQKVVIENEVDSETLKEKFGNGNIVVGNEVTFTLSDGREITHQVAHIEDGYAYIVAKDIICCMPMYYDWRDANGYGNSKVFKYLDELYEKYPDEVKSLITVREMSETIRGEKRTFSAPLWIPSYEEVFNKFDLFSTYGGRVKMYNGDTAFWWCRSVSASNSDGFCYVYGGGGAGSSSANCSSGVAPAFLVKLP